MPIGVYPGSFNPLTIAHVGIARAAREQCGLDRVDLVVSRTALGKEDDPDLVEAERRVAELEVHVAGIPWLGARVSDHQLVAHLADGYDVVVLGADKWHQLLDSRWYPSVEARDELLARLPRVAIAPRPPFGLDGLDGFDAVVLDIDPRLHEVSATAVRAGRNEWAHRSSERST